MRPVVLPKNGILAFSASLSCTSVHIFVIPAPAGIQRAPTNQISYGVMDSRLRGNDRFTWKRQLDAPECAVISAWPSNQRQGAIFCMAIPVGRVVASEDPVQCKAGGASSCGEWLIRV